MKAKVISLPLFAIAVMFFASCAKLPVYQAKKGASVDIKRPIADEANSKNLIDYGVFADDTNLYVQVNLYNSDNLTRIQQSGLNVYFNKGKKKKKNWQLAIEKSDKMGMMSMSMGNQQSNSMSQGNQQSQGGNQQPPAMPGNSNSSMSKAGSSNSAQGMGQMSTFSVNEADMICKSLGKITWTKGVQEYVFYRNSLYKDPMSVDLSSARKGVLTVTVKMPLVELEVATGDMLAIGIETGSSDSDSNQMQQGGGMMGGGAPGGMGGGPGGGMGGPGGPGGSMGGGSGMGGSGGMQNSNQSSGKALHFWFAAQL